VNETVKAILVGGIFGSISGLVGCYFASADIGTFTLSDYHKSIIFAITVSIILFFVFSVLYVALRNDGYTIIKKMIIKIIDKTDIVEDPKKPKRVVRKK
jgi:hypothetical protein